MVGGSNSGRGVYGRTNQGIGVSGLTNQGMGVAGSTASGHAIYAYSNQGVGLSATCESGDGMIGVSLDGAGVAGLSHAAASPGVLGINDYSSAVEGISVYGIGVNGTSRGIGVRGSGLGTGAAVVGITEDGTAVLGRVTGAAGLAGAFLGTVAILGGLRVSGSLDVFGTKNFKIDHPSDPEHRYLSHTCVESSEMKNVYDGVVRLDEGGAAWVELPAWFEALNGDFRYQLTAVGGPAPELHIAEEISESRFKIAGGEARMKVCWQVTGTRRDRWAAANPFEVEQEKRGEERGRYLHPKLYDAPEEQGVPGPIAEALRVAATPPTGEKEVQELRRRAEEGPRPPQPPGTDSAQVDAVRRHMQEREREIEELRQQINQQEERPPEMR